MKMHEDVKLPCGVVLKNRIVKSAMSEALANHLDNATDQHVRLYRTWAQGGAALLITGNVMVDRRYLERPGNIVLEDQAGIAPLTKMATAGREGGAHIWMQISHPGRQCPKLISKSPLAPSAVQLKMLGNFGKPREMNDGDINDVIARFATTAGLAQKAGFSGVQINAAHGFLISQFLSPKVNLRGDKWGGCLQNRSRLLLEIITAIRAHVGAEFAISVKLNAADFQRGGFTLDESAQVALWLSEAGIDHLDITGGDFEHLRLFGHKGDPREVSEPDVIRSDSLSGYFTDCALSIADRLSAVQSKVSVMATGGFRSRDAIEHVLGIGGIDMIGLGRPFCTTPDIASRLLDGGNVEMPAMAPKRVEALVHGLLSRTKVYRVLRAQSEVAWFGRQIKKIANGTPRSRKVALLSALCAHMTTDVAHAKRRTSPPTEVIYTGDV